MGLLKMIFGNTRKPQGRLGKMMTKSMNGYSHAKMAEWGMQYLQGIQPSSVCDLGCGGGANVKRLLERYPQAEVTGLDYSEVSVATTKDLNAQEIAQGRCQVILGDVSNITLPAESVDLATAFETIYFWPGLEKCFREVYRTLKPGGHFLIVNEADGEDGTNEKWEKIIEMKTYTRAEISDALQKAGFTEIRTYHHDKKSYIAVLAGKNG